MKTLYEKFYLFSCNFIHILALAFTGLLFVGGFFFTCYADDMVGQQVLTTMDNPLAGILGMGLLGGVLLCACRLICRKADKGRQILLILVFGWIMLLGGFLILFGRTAPAADAWSVYSAAESMALGDTSVIHPTDSYLSYYPQQVGLMAFFELLIRLWKLLPTDLQAYHFIKCLYVVLSCIIVYYQYLCVHLLWEDNFTDCVYLALAGANLPLVMYSSFVYGEIPSFAAMSAGMYYFLKICKTGQTGWSVPLRSLVLLTLAVMLRKNSLVIIIAIVLVALLEGLRTNLRAKRRQCLLFALLCVICSLSILPVTQKIYECRAGNTLKSGVPAMSYFAMGMQESSRGNGWYNGFNFNTYQETGMDTAATEQISRQFMAERTAYFRAHPDYAVSFYWNKYLSQWADGTYASRQATLATFGGRRPIVESIYSGENSHLYIAYCNIYQNILYFGCLTGCILTLHKRRQSRPMHNPQCDLFIWLGVIGAFGGFLFHMIWEANARYIFLYGLLLLPYAAHGLTGLSNTYVPGKSRKNNTAH